VILDALVKRTLFQQPPWPDLVAVLALAILVSVGLIAPALLLSAAAGVVLVSLAAWETLTPPER
jgi:low temperature requirement protein LtrA